MNDYIKVTFTFNKTLNMNKNIEKIIVDYIPLANKLAWQKSLSVPKHVTFEDLKSAAYMGLVDAANKFDPKVCPSFSAYARIRISGEIKDYLKKIARGNAIVLDSEINSAEENKDARDTDDFFDFVSKKLGDMDGKIMRMYYVEDRTLGEIGRSRGVTESRMSQIIKSCHERLRCFLV